MVLNLSKLSRVEFSILTPPKKTISINKIIEPVYLWNKSFKISTSDKANSLLKTYYTKLSDSTNYASKAELYGLLIVKEFEEKQIS